MEPENIRGEEMVSCDTLVQYNPFTHRECERCVEGVGEKSHLYVQEESADG